MVNSFAKAIGIYLKCVTIPLTFRSFPGAAPHQSKRFQLLPPLKRLRLRPQKRRVAHQSIVVGTIEIRVLEMLLAALLFVVGFMPLFGGPTYEFALVSGLIANS